MDLYVSYMDSMDNVLLGEVSGLIHKRTHTTFYSQFLETSNNLFSSQNFPGNSDFPTYQHKFISKSILKMKMTNLKCGHSLLQNDGSHAHIVIIGTCKVFVVISNNESSMVTCTLTMCISTQSMHLEIGFIRIYRVYEDFMFLLEIPSSYGKFGLNQIWACDPSF